MNSNAGFVAQLEVREVVVGWRKASATQQEFLTILGAVAGLTFLILVWAIFLRRRPRRDRSSFSRHFHPPKRALDGPERETSPVPSPSGAMEASADRRRGRRRRARHKRRRNPTLAETGGLPPVRPESPPEYLP